MNIIPYIWRYARGRPWITLILHVSVVSAFFLPLLLPLFNQQLIDLFVQQQADIESVYTVAYKIVAIMVGIWVSWRVLEFSIVPAQMHILEQAYKHAFSHLQRHSYRFFSDNFSGALVKKVGRYIGALEDIMDIWIFQIISMCISIPAILIFVFMHSTII